MSNVTIYLNDYQPYAFTIHAATLNFDLYDDHALVSNTMQLQRVHTGELRLDGDALELISIHLNDVLLPVDAYHLDANCLIIPACPDQCTLTIVTKIYPQNNTQLSGLYRSNQLFCTQCEAEGFRRITFFPDRPDVLTTYTTRISADKTLYPTLLSNGNLQASGDADNNRHWVIWHDPFKKPSYLFALVAGQLACIADTFTTSSGKIVDLHIYVEPENTDKCAHAMQSLKKAMRWDETEYGREYDLSIFMIVAVSDFNMGAMENKGLNIFNSKYILARPDTATDSDYAAIEGVIAHEYFHNWTGNRVTCRDWFQLSLKEGLTVFRDQEFSRDMNSRDVNRIADVKVLRNAQFPEDAGRMAHPVRPSSYQEINNFYTATIYDKGAEVIRMQHTLLGREGFRRGMDLYFERHDGHAVTIDDFVAAMEDANTLDLTQFKRWYSQAGTPRVTMRSNYKDGQLTLFFTQSCPATLECQEKLPFHIPIQIGLFDAKGEVLPISNPVLELREFEQTFCFNGIAEQPIISLLRDFSAPIILQRDATQEELLALLRFETNGFAKWDAAQQLALSCILQCYDDVNNDWYIPLTLLDAYRQILIDDNLDSALRAELLTPPSFEDVIQLLTNADVKRIEHIRDFFRLTLSQHLYQDAKTLYQRLWAIEDHAMNGHAYAQRQLRNVCLGLMMKANESETLFLCQQQFKTAQTMTDQMASFVLLVNSSTNVNRQQAIEDFYQQWCHDDLVMDKWFAVQAASEASDTLAHVRQLLSHPKFNLKNPNKVRSLLSVFFQTNPRHFHAIDGSGYVFLTEMLIQLDKINSQISARLATPFTRWQQLDHQRQVLIKAELKKLIARDLSRDLREVVEKSCA